MEPRRTEDRLRSFHLNSNIDPVKSDRTESEMLGEADVNKEKIVDATGYHDIEDIHNYIVDRYEIQF